MSDALRRIRSVADYQFGKGVGTVLFPKSVKIVYSARTGRIRYIYLDGKRLVTLRPTDGLFTLSILGAKRIAQAPFSGKYYISVREDVSQFIANGGDVFAVHVVSANGDVRSKDEVIVVGEQENVLAVGRAVLSGEEMKAFQIGVAVKVRHGCMEES